MARKKELTKDEKIKAEIKRLTAALSDLDANKMAIVKPLIRTAAFTSVSLDEVEQIINVEGYTDRYQNGENQYGTKQSDNVKTQLAMQKNLTGIIKALADVAPAAKSKSSRLQELMGK